jgi:hypothetical protein
MRTGVVCLWEVFCWLWYCLYATFDMIQTTATDNQTHAGHTTLGKSSMLTSSHTQCTSSCAAQDRKAAAERNKEKPTNPTHRVHGYCNWQLLTYCTPAWHSMHPAVHTCNDCQAGKVYIVMEVIIFRHLQTAQPALVMAPMAQLLPLLLPGPCTPACAASSAGSGRSCRSSVPHGSPHMHMSCP